MRRDVAVVILAGGVGTRIGGGKPIRRLAGERLIDRALRMARRWSDIVAVAVRDPIQIQPIDAPVILDEPGVVGPLAGLAAALRFGSEAGAEFVLTIPADSPFLPSDLLDRLGLEIGPRGCALACSGGQLHPVCGLWRTSTFGQLDDFLRGERRSLRDFAARIAFYEVVWPSEPLDPFFNINTADQLVEAESRIGG